MFISNIMKCVVLGWFSKILLNDPNREGGKFREFMILREFMIFREFHDITL